MKLEKMKSFQLPIRTTLLISITILNLLIALPLSYMMWVSVVDYFQAERMETVIETNNLLYDAKKQFSVERAASYSLLDVPANSLPVLRKDLRQSRKIADSDLNKAIAALEREKNPELASAMREVKSRYAFLKEKRDRLDKAASLLSTQRQKDISDEVFEDITALQKGLDILIEEHSESIRDYNSAVTHQMRFTRFVGEIGEYIGQQYAILGRVIARNEYPTGEVRDKLLLLRNRIEYGLDTANAAASATPASKVVMPLMKEAETHYFITFEQISSLLNGPPEGVDRTDIFYPISVEIWLELASQAVDSLNAMTDAVLKANHETVAHVKEDAESGIIASLFLFLVAILISVYTWRLVRLRVIDPVNSMVEALYKETRLSGKDISESTGTDEIGKLEQVLRAFQENSRQLQEERDKAQAANVAKSEFLANMSHEIRTPMNVIVGISNIMSSSKVPPEKHAEFIKTLKISADSLLALINDLLDFSKLETHSLELEKINFNLEELLEETATVMRVKAQEKGLAFNIDCGPVQGREFIGDPNRIRQILNNVCSNAIKFTEQGEIDLKVALESHERPHYRNIVITVTDTGIGIPEDKIPLVFDKFSQADSSISRKFGGTGLGLAITKSLVELMKGDVTVESKVGEGTVFTVRLPLITVAQSEFAYKEQAKPGRKSRKKAANKRVLIVEDYYPNVVVTATFLDEFGYEYDVAQDGREAVKKFIENGYGLVLMDIQMPGMDGYQTTRSIRKYEEENNRGPARIIGLTAHATPNDREKCLQAGMDDYLAKPFDPDDLERLLRKAA